MKNKGWIKLHRKELEWFSELNDREFRYFMISKMNIVWDKRSQYFGTFDARTKIVKREMFPDWSAGKINTTKNSLLKKGYYEKGEDYRLKIKNAELFLKNDKLIETMIQVSEKNLHITETKIYKPEKMNRDIKEASHDLMHLKRMENVGNILNPENRSWRKET